MILGSRGYLFLLISISLPPLLSVYCHGEGHVTSIIQVYVFSFTVNSGDILFFENISMSERTQV